MKESSKDTPKEKSKQCAHDYELLRNSRSSGVQFYFVTSNCVSWASLMAQWQRICLQCRRCWFDPWVREGGNGNPLQYSCLGNPMDRGAWRATVYAVTKSQTRLKRLSSSSSYHKQCFSEHWGTRVSFHSGIAGFFFFNFILFLNFT